MRTEEVDYEEEEEGDDKRKVGEIGYKEDRRKGREESEKERGK